MYAGRADPSISKDIRGVLSPGGEETSQEHLSKNRAGILVLHGNGPAGARRDRGEKSRSIQQELCIDMGVRCSYIPAQGHFQKTDPAGLGGAVYEENYEAYAYGSHVLLMGP